MQRHFVHRLRQQMLRVSWLIFQSIYKLTLSLYRWDPKKRMTPEEAVHHEWLQTSSSSSTFIITSSTSSSSLMKLSRDQLKENDQTQQQMMQKYQRSQPVAPLTILPQIKTPSNRVSQRYNTSTINGTKESSRVKGELRNGYQNGFEINLIIWNIYLHA